MLLNEQEKDALKLANGIEYDYQIDAVEHAILSKIESGSHSKYRIEKGVEMPFISAALESVYPMAIMDIGDSFLVDDLKGKLQSLRSAVSRYGVKNNKSFAVRVVDNGIRVWRVK